MKLEGMEAMTRKQVEDMERNLSAAEVKHTKTVEEIKKTKKTTLDLQAGIEHLFGRLNEIRIDSSSKQKFDNIQTVTQDNMVECLEQSRQKLKLMMKEMKEDPELYAEAIRNVNSEAYHSNPKRTMSEYQRDASKMSA